MNYEISIVPRKAFTWLDDTVLIVTTIEEGSGVNGHCIALNTVRPDTYFKF